MTDERTWNDARPILSNSVIEATKWEKEIRTAGFDGSFDVEAFGGYAQGELVLAFRLRD
jgi:hypothetical protein